MLASEVLGDNRGGSGQKSWAAAWESDLRKRARAASMHAGAAGHDNGRGRAATGEDHALTGHIHCHVRTGNDGRGAQRLDSSCTAVADDATIAQLKALHPPVPPPIAPPVDEGPAGPAGADADRFLGIIQCLPQGTAAGLSGWTYEHVPAAGWHSQRARDRIRGFMNDLLSGDIPHCHLFLAS